MEYLIIQAVHVVGALGLFAALGAILLGGSEAHQKVASALHGGSLLVLLAFGLYLLFRFELAATGGWWHVKILLWLILGAAPAIARRRFLPPGALFGIFFAIGAFATFLGLAKPF